MIDVAVCGLACFDFVLAFVAAWPIVRVIRDTVVALLVHRP